MLGWIEGYFTGFQFEGLLAVWLKPKRSLQHVDRLVSRMVVNPGNAAGWNIREKHDDLLALQPGHGLSQYLGPRYLWHTLSADVSGANCADHHAHETGNEKKQGSIHGFLLRNATQYWRGCLLTLALLLR
jgi:hypothetical protein